jgi:hypothetical protein
LRTRAARSSPADDAARRRRAADVQLRPVASCQADASAITDLTTKVTANCSKINLEVTHVNALRAGVDELVGALNLVPGGFLPMLPANTSAITC